MLFVISETDLRHELPSCTKAILLRSANYYSIVAILFSLVAAYLCEMPTVSVLNHRNPDSH